jgi:hypothetical protein
MHARTCASSYDDCEPDRRTPGRGRVDLQQRLSVSLASKRTVPYLDYSVVVSSCLYLVPPFTEFNLVSIYLP